MYAHSITHAVRSRTLDEDFWRNLMRGSSQAYSTSDNSTPGMNIAEAITTGPITSEGLPS